MSVAAQVVRMHETAEMARQDMMAALQADLSRTRLRPLGHDILIAMYNRAGKKTAGGLIIPGSNREDEFQGKVGLVLALGPMCCEEKSLGYDEWFGGEPPVVGSWVGVSNRDGVTILLGETTCRLVEWKYLRFCTDAQDLVM